jgi:hypothetical protein
MAVRVKARVIGAQGSIVRTKCEGKMKENVQRAKMLVRSDGKSTSKEVVHAGSRKTSAGTFDGLAHDIAMIGVMLPRTF